MRRLSLQVLFTSLPCLLASIDRLELINPLLISPDNSTNTYQANPLYETCTCDLKALSCDANCCCDSDCSFALRAQWVNEKSCINYNYDSLQGTTLGKCVKNDQIYDYNRRKGLTEYIDPFTKLFCVYINNSPKMDYYYSQINTISNEEIDKLINKKEKQGFVGTMFTAEEKAREEGFYNEGEKMYSKLTNGILQYNRGFPMPRADMNGQCNNFQSPLFMQNLETECTQTFNIETECTSKVNPFLFTTQLLIYSGKSSFYSQQIPVSVNQTYSFDDETNTYTEVDVTTFTESSLSKDDPSNFCSCNKALKEVHYTVRVTPKVQDNARPYFQIDNITSVVVINANPIEGQCGSSKSIQQRYSIRFISGNEILTQSKSGNPGYIIGLPLLVGQKDTVTDAIQVYERGYQLTGADQNGQCIDTQQTGFSDFGDPIVKFGENLIYSCYKEMTLDELRAYCQNSAATTNSQIFQRLSFWQKYGQFGNANLYNPKDWEDISTELSFSNLGTGTWNENTKTCSIYSGVHFKVYYSKMGFTDNPQNYVVDVYKSAVQETWTFTKSSNTIKQRFEHFVGVEYNEVSEEKLSKKSFISAPTQKIPSDFWYPFYIRSSSITLAVSAAALVLSIISQF